MAYVPYLPGTSITIYFILANDDYTTPTTTLTECNFMLNGTLEKSYVHTPLPNKGTEYNVEVFKKEGLEDRMHSLNVDTGKKNHEVFLAFDYATYTVEEPDDDTDNHNGTTAALPSTSESSEPKSSSPTGAIVGGVIGCLVFIGGTLAAFFVYRKRHKGVNERGYGQDNTVHVDPADVGQSRSLDPIQASGRLSDEASNSLTRRQQQELSRMRGESSNLESQGRHGDHHTPSDSDTIRSGVIQRETSELREQIRELQAQMARQRTELAISDTLPPTYAP
ncbi:hypothetical protein AAF712_010454 [Marasmius tenuissimus]|uniref:Uncharacterized protein n=1 Tax=Marasmius tenuissimus TaxID=585030 RepID=A0ABR2ZN57_9AGAR